MTQTDTSLNAVSKVGFENLLSGQLIPQRELAGPHGRDPVPFL